MVSRRQADVEEGGEKTWDYFDGVQVQPGAWTGGANMRVKLDAER